MRTSSPFIRFKQTVALPTWQTVLFSTFYQSLVHLENLLRDIYRPTFAIIPRACSYVENYKTTNIRRRNYAFNPLGIGFEDQTRHTITDYAVDTYVSSVSSSLTRYIHRQTFSFVETKSISIRSSRVGQSIENHIHTHTYLFTMACISRDVHHTLVHKC